MKSKFFVIVLLVLFASMAMAAETYYNRSVEWDDEPGYVLYTSGTILVSDTITATVYYTKAMKIGPFTESYAYATFQVAGTTTGTEDINVIVEYANDPDDTNAIWVLGAGTTDSDLDAVGTTVVLDTIGIVAATAEAKYKTYTWMRYKFVLGQANMAGKIIKFSTKFTKPEGLKARTVGQSAKDTPDS